MQNKHLAVINVVALTKGLVSKENTPFIYQLQEKLLLKTLTPTFPAVTTTAQSAMLTGKKGTEHGIVGNGWYFDELAEVAFWKQNNQLVQSPKIWQTLKSKHHGFTCANTFWWYNMYSTVDYSMTPRPHYLADGGKVFDLYSFPENLHQSIEETIGKFPFFSFWGPKAGIGSSQWIAKAAVELQRQKSPNLHLIYLPHLDYNLQKLGPNHPEIAKDLQKIDRVIKNLCNELEQLNTDFILVSEYGISAVQQAIHINRVLREQGYIKVRSTLGLELLDCGACEAFAVADHQVAHIYIKDKDKIAELKAFLTLVDGVETVIDQSMKGDYGIDHRRAGDLILIAKDTAWFTYYYWLDDTKAPDFARTIDIHRKPGYDPLEMFLDPSIPLVSAKILWKLLLKKLGFRYLLDVIPLDAQLIKGSHGRLSENPALKPIIMTTAKRLEKCESLTDVYHVINNYFDE